MYVLKVSSKDMAARASVNDVDLLRVHGAELSESAEFTGQWLDNTNTLALTILGPGPFTKGHPGFADGKGTAPEDQLEQGLVKAQVIRLPDGFRSAEANGTVVAEVEWKFDPDVGVPAFPITLSRTFAARSTLDLHWRRSLLPQPTPQTRASLLAWLKELQRMFQAGDARAVVDRMEYSISDLCRTMGADFAAQRKEIEESIVDVLPLPGLEPITDEILTIRPQANSKMLLCTRPDGTDLIKTVPNPELDFSLAVRVGWVNGQWRLL